MRNARRLTSIAIGCIGIVTLCPPVLAQFGNARPVDTEPRRAVKLMINFASADSIVRSIQQLSIFRDQYPIELQAIAHDNSIIVTGTADNIREAKNSINLFDVLPKMISLKAEAILVLSDRAGHKHRAVLSGHSLVTPGRPIRLRSTVEGEPAAASDISMTSGRSDVQVQARINGDNSISLEGDWEYDFVWRVPGQAKPLHIHNSFGANGRAKSGDTISVSGSINKTGGDKAGLDAEILLFLTPVIQRQSEGGVRNAAIKPKALLP